LLNDEDTGATESDLKVFLEDARLFVFQLNSVNGHTTVDLSNARYGEPCTAVPEGEECEFGINGGKVVSGAPQYQAA